MPRKCHKRRRAVLAGTLLGACVWLLDASAAADTVLSDFNAASPGSYNPRDGWQAFGNGTLDSGVISGGSLGNGAYHSVNWGTAAWGVGDLATGAVDLSPFTEVTVDARLVDTGGHTGVGLLRLALDLPGGTEWSTTSQTLTGGYQTFVFDLNSMTRTAGSGPLDLAAGTPKLIVAKNGQSGTARIDFDEIIGVNGGGPGPYVLTPVVMNAPPDGDAVRAMWLYAFAGNLRVDTAADSQEILDFCAQEGVNRLYFHVSNILGGTQTLRDNLRTFLSTAHASGIAVEAHIDGIDEYQSTALITNHIDDVLAFHAETPGDSSDDFDGIHCDLEFWASAAWGAAANESQRRNIAIQYLDNILVAGRQHLDANGGAALTIGVDLSSHFDTSGMLPSVMTYNSVSQHFLEHVLDYADEVVLMSYIDSAGGLLSWTDTELDFAAAKGRTLQLAADIAPVPPEVPINSFADNFTPTPFSAMLTALESFHDLLNASRLAALDGFTVFHYDHFLSRTPRPRSLADLNGDAEVDTGDFSLLISYLSGPAVSPPRVGLDADFDGDGAVSMSDFQRFQICFTGPGCGCPVPADCQR